VAFALLPAWSGIVMQGATGRVIVGLLWLAIVVAMAGAWSAGARSATIIAPRPAAAPKPVVEYRAVPRMDLYGNPIEEAVTDYRIDPSGDVYERHAPDTAVLELSAPSL
jgi:hypothetical protein